MLKIRLWGLASVICRAWAAVALARCFEGYHDKLPAAVLPALIFGAAWHAAEIAKRQALDLTFKAEGEDNAK